ncbi:MAG: YqzL family protein [Clostridia bacterium]|nr:YqzL family protein [Clostridia bacterium]
MKNLSWQAFKKTGDIDAYLLYCATRDNEKHEENQWKALKQEASSQSAVTLGNQTL